FRFLGRGAFLALARLVGALGLALLALAGLALFRFALFLTALAGVLALTLLAAGFAAVLRFAGTLLGFAALARLVSLELVRELCRRVRHLRLDIPCVFGRCPTVVQDSLRDFLIVDDLVDLFDQVRDPLRL